MTSETPLARYDRLCESGMLNADAEQRAVVEALDALWHQADDESDQNWFASLFRKSVDDEIRGVYLWGDVGRGKSMVMDLFFECLPAGKKKRVHFHAFMRDIHSRIFAWRQLKPKGDLLELVARDVASGIQVLCLDEMQVHDITDASILSRLFTQLFEHGLLIVITSNRPPRDLYQGGLQREQFEPFIALLREKTRVLDLNGPTDYRLQQLRAMDQTYVYPLNERSEEFCHNAYCALTNDCASSEQIIEVAGRNLVIERTSNGVAWLTFSEMCEHALGAADYLEVAAVFHTVILQGIPELSPEKRNEAKRFVTLIDALYEHKVKLLCTAAAAPEHLYPSGHGAFEFERTVSRLIEMQSERYLAMPHVKDDIVIASKTP